VIIENYYITGIHSNNTQNYASFHIYIYLPNDYDHTTDIIDIFTLQLDSMRTAGYPTSPLGIRDAQVTAIFGDIPTSEPDDDPIDTATRIIPQQLSPYPPNSVWPSPPTPQPQSACSSWLAGRHRGPQQSRTNTYYPPSQKTSATASATKLPP
jgi:hypothetical protein